MKRYSKRRFSKKGSFKLIGGMALMFFGQTPLLEGLASSTWTGPSKEEPSPLGWNSPSYWWNEEVPRSGLSIVYVDKDYSSCSFNNIENLKIPEISINLYNPLQNCCIGYDPIKDEVIGQPIQINSQGYISFNAHCNDAMAMLAHIHLLGSVKIREFKNIDTVFLQAPTNSMQNVYTLKGISGEGPLIFETGDSSFRLLGRNTYKKGTLITNASVTIDHPEAFGEGPIELDGGSLTSEKKLETPLKNPLIVSGEVVVNALDGASLHLSGEISSQGKIRIENNRGQLLINGNNTYTGGTYIGSSQSVSIGHSRALGVSSVVLGDDSVLSIVENDLSISNDFQLEGQKVSIDSANMKSTFEGSFYSFFPCQLQIQGENSQVKLKGKSSFFGETYIQGGARLILAHQDGIGSSTLHIKDRGMIDFSKEVNSFQNPINCSGSVFCFVDANHNVSLSSALNKDSNPHLLTSSDDTETYFSKVGLGSLNLEGGDKFSFPLIKVDEGSLLVNKSTDTSIEVSKSARLGGNGDCLSIYNQGVVSPGCSIGTLTTSSFEQTSSGVLEIEIASFPQVDKLVVEGEARLSGTLKLISLPGVYQKGRVYDFLDAQSIEGSFSQLDFSQSIFSSSSLHLDSDGSNHQRLVIDQNRLQFKESIKGVNSQKIVKNLEKKVDSFSPSLITELERLVESPNPQRTLLRLSPSFLESLALLNIDSMEGFNDSFKHESSRGVTAYLMGENRERYHFWIKPLYSHRHLSAHQENVGFKSSHKGINVSFDCVNEKGSRLGLMTGYTKESINGQDECGEAKTQSGILGFYGELLGEEWYVKGSISGVVRRGLVSRAIPFSSQDRLAHHEHQGLGASSQLEVGKDYHMDGLFFINPYAIFDYHYYHQNSLEETGNTEFSLMVKDKKYNHIRSNLGLCMTKIHQIGESFLFKPSLFIGYLCQAQMGKDKYQSRFVTDDSWFETDLKRKPWHLCQTGVNLSLLSDLGFQLTLSYKGAFNHLTSFHTVGLDWNFKF
ncbi:MAG: autotransporter domain-containing protein [Rhabdochlamydiaceae bacterium]